MEKKALLLLWRQALTKKCQMVALLADVQLDCEELEYDVMDELGEETALKALRKFYDLGDTDNAKGRFMLSISSITYKSVTKSSY